MKRILIVGFAAIAPAPVSTPASAGSFAFNTFLAYGMRGTAVTALQNVLIAQGTLAPQYATGFFGSLTQAVLQKLQYNKGIVCSGSHSATGWGLVGPKTRSVLNAL